MTDTGFVYKYLGNGAEEVEVDLVIAGSGPGSMKWPLNIRENAHVSALVLQIGEDLSREPEINTLLQNRLNQSTDFMEKFYRDKGNGVTQPEAVFRAFRNSNEMAMLGGTGSGNNGNQIYSSTGVLDGIARIVPGFVPTEFQEGLKNIEKYDGKTDPRNPNARGTSGPFAVTQVPIAGPNVSSQLITNTWKTVIPELPVIIDPNNPITPVGFTPQYQLAMSVPKDDPTNPGVRTSPATVAYGPDKFTQTLDVNGFRQDLKNPNLRLSLNTFVVRATFRPNSNPLVVKTLECVRYVNGQPRALTVRVRLAAVSACGMSSPALLQRSGIGARELLTKYAIPTLVENPEVGQNIATGILVNTAYSKAQGAANNLTDAVNAGATNTNGATFSAGPTFNDPTATRRTILTTTQDGLRPNSYTPSGTTARTGVFLVDTKTRGETYITSTDALKQETTDWKLFEGAGAQDAETLADFLITCFAPFTAQLRASTGGVWGNVTAPPTALFNDRPGMIAWVKANAIPTCHVTGGCRMGPDDPASPERGVTNADGLVHKTTNFYVSDASVAPVQPDCNSAPMAYGMGIWIADRYFRSRGWVVSGEAKSAKREAVKCEPLSERLMIAYKLAEVLEKMGFDTSSLRLPPRKTDDDDDDVYEKDASKLAGSSSRLPPQSVDNYQY